MKKWFNSQSRLVQIILLLIPVVNWIIEICIRWPEYLEKKSLLHLLVAIICTIPTGIAWGYVDLVWCLLFKHLCLA